MSKTIDDDLSDLVIEIADWGRYNPRKDVSRPSWVRFDHDFFENPLFYDLLDQERLVWISFLCLASRTNNSGKFTVNSQYFHRVLGIDVTVVKNAIKKLEQKQVIVVRTLRGRYADVTQTSRYRTNVTNVTRREEKNKSPEQPEFPEPLCSAEPLRSATDTGKPGPRCLSNFQPIEEVIRQRKVSEGVQLAWLDAFPDDPWVCKEVRRAIAWEAANPRRKKKDFGRFITSWLNRSWDRRRV